MRERIAIAAAITGLIITVSVAPGPRLHEADPRALVSVPDSTLNVPSTPDEPPPLRAGDPVALRAFATCGEFLGHVRARAAEIVGPNGLESYFGWFDGPVAFATDTSAGFGAARMAPQPPIGLPALPPAAFSETNVQVGGVDEPDIVKTDGRTIFWLGERTLHAVAVDGEGSMRSAGSVRLGGWDHTMLLAGDRALIFARVWRAPGLESGSITRVFTVDVSDPDHLEIVSTTDFEGSFVSARLIDGTARLVIRSQQASKLRFRGPLGWTGPDITAAIERNKRVIERSPADVWLPRLATGTGDTRTTRPFVTCSTVHTPKAFSGLDLVSVVTLDPANPASQHTASILGGGDTVYATSDRLFVATTQFVAATEQRSFKDVWTTQIHAFDISDPSGARYRASGEVEGQLKDQWALDLHQGFLRVATTIGVPWEPSSESAVTVLQERDGRLERVGRVGDLGRIGERIYAVRFIGDVGYVVTFRLIDPLYTLDLSDPTEPRVLGELKIPGYSAYLHPIGDGLLLGIGQGATRRGVTRGTQVSLFDVSDPAEPRRIDHLTFSFGHSEAEGDHHAFLYWPATGSLVVPLSKYGRESFVGAVGIRVEEGTLTEVARVTHQRGTLEQVVLDVWRAAIRRSVVVGDTLFTLSDQGMLASDLDTYAERGWLGWERSLRHVAGYAGREEGFRDGWSRRAKFRQPGQVALGYRGEVWVADTGNRAVRKVEWGSTTTPRIEHPDGTVGTRFPGEPVGVAPDSRRRVFVATPCALWSMPSDGGRVQQVAGDCSDTNGIFGPADGIGSAARFGSLGHIARAADGSILAVDTGAHAVRRVTIGEDGVGTVTTVAGSLGRPGHVDEPGSQARFQEPTGITVLPSGDVLVADSGNHVVRRLEPKTWRVATIAGTPGRPSESAGDGRLRSPHGLAYDAVTERIYVTEAGAHRITAIDDGTVTIVAGDGAAGLRSGALRGARFRSPSGLLVMGEGLLVADTGNHRLRWIR